MVHTDHTISVYDIDDPIDADFTDFHPGNTARRPKTSSYRVAPTECEVEDRCELIKSTYEVISKYTRAMFDKQNETVV